MGERGCAKAGCRVGAGCRCSEVVIVWELEVRTAVKKGEEMVIS